MFKGSKNCHIIYANGITQRGAIKLAIGVLLKQRERNLLRMCHCLNYNLYLYLASNLVIVTSFIEQEAPPMTESNFLEGLPKMKAGFLGEGRVVSLLSIRLTTNIVGRSTTFSSTHNRPT